MIVDYYWGIEGLQKDFMQMKKQALSNQLINGHLPCTTAKAPCLMEENKDKLNSSSDVQKAYRIILEKHNMQTLTAKPSI